MASSAFFAGRDVIRWGIIGCGDVTEVKSGPGLQLAAGSQLVAVMRRDAAKAADYARRHGVPRWYTDADALIHDPEVDAVYVATPPDSHEEYARRVAAAGKPTYVEKPMARSAAECDRMVAAFARAGLPLFVAYYRRRLPRFLKAEELIQTGAIGRVSGVTWRFAAPRHLADAGWRVDVAAAGSGLFLDLASHTLDLLDYLLGPLQDVAGVASNVASLHAAEDTVAMSFRTPGGVAGMASCNFAGAVADDTLRITGTEGEIALTVFGHETLRLEQAGGVREFHLPNPPHVAQPLIQTVVDDLLGRGVCPSTGETAQRTSQVMDTVLAGYYGGRGDGFWTRPETWPGRRKS